MKLVNLGEKYSSIADKFNVTKNAIGYIARKNGVFRYERNQ